MRKTHRKKRVVIRLFQGTFEKIFFRDGCSSEESVYFLIEDIGWSDRSRWQAGWALRTDSGSPYGHPDSEYCHGNGKDLPHGNPIKQKANLDVRLTKKLPDCPEHTVSADKTPDICCLGRWYVLSRRFYRGFNRRMALYP